MALFVKSITILDEYIFIFWYEFVFLTVCSRLRSCPIQWSMYIGNIASDSWNTGIVILIAQNFPMWYEWSETPTMMIMWCGVLPHFSTGVGWLNYRLYCRDKLGKSSFSNLWTSWRPKIPIGRAVLTVLWKTTPNKYQLPSHLSLFNAIYRGEPSLPTSVLAFCLDASFLSQRRHKSWNFSFAEKQKQKMGNLGAKVGAFSCSDWGASIGEHLSNLRHYQTIIRGT